MGLSIRYLIGGKFTEQEYSILSSNDEVLDFSKPSRETSTANNLRFGHARFKVFAASISTGIALALFFTFLGWKMCSLRQNSLLRTPVPSFPKEIRYFERNQTFIDPPNPESDIAWNKLLPDGRGYIYVENGAKYGLEPGVQKETGEIYGVSMFHQIHCLGVIRRDYYKLAMGIQTDDHSVKKEAERQLAYEHTGHCFDYLRQAFECSGDMTLEWPRTEKDGSRFQTDGTGIPHVCASKDAIMDYMEVYGYREAHNHDIAA
ncbi:Protein of unknown function DUF3328 [Penicillium cf. griseofulvum]|uniref:Uncharacterized protein n=1 Tax=Penicillium cf. griseofulvum TaxID=2972120 RepID=A0A9W9J273_9EURO|nr:Protein of unknown function DUF3328 [Penicillium cf. griseofulvum]KAJ5434322.1 Protein of unknown function DUF3328 [Penicillium cf. griseofulvum]KAJ5452154.1 Protein of unknown function DUF3328 [Penicillium cf. griseofulvum]